MTIACKPSTTASIYADKLLQQGSPAFAEGIVDMANLLERQSNPVAGYNQDQLLSTTKQLTTALRRSNLQQYPYLESRVQQSPILFPEVADFLNQSSSDIATVQATANEFIEYSATVNNGYDIIQPNDFSTDYKNTLDQLEFYYVGNLANSISGGFCGVFGNVFGKLLGILGAIEAGLDLIANLLSIDLTFLFKLAKLKLSIEALKKKLLAIVDKLKETFLNQIKNIVKQFENIANDIVNTVESIKETIRKRINDVKSFFEDGSIDGIKEKIEEFIQKSIDQFEELTPENIALLLFRFCQFAELIQGFMKGPIDGIQRLAVAVTVEKEILDSLSLRETEKAVEAGAVRLSEKEIPEVKAQLKRAFSGVNNEAEQPNDRDLNDLKSLSNNELQDIAYGNQSSDEALVAAAVLQTRGVTVGVPGGDERQSQFIDTVKAIRSNSPLPV